MVHEESIKVDDVLMKCISKLNIIPPLTIRYKILLFYTFCCHALSLLSGLLISHVAKLVHSINHMSVALSGIHEQLHATLKILIIKAIQRSKKVIIFSHLKATNKSHCPFELDVHVISVLSNYSTYDKTYFIQ